MNPVSAPGSESRWRSASAHLVVSLLAAFVAGVAVAPVNAWRVAALAALAAWLVGASVFVMGVWAGARPAPRRGQSLSLSFKCATSAEGEVDVGRPHLMRCCVDDEGFVALRRRPAGGGVKPPQAALAEDRRGER